MSEKVILFVAFMVMNLYGASYATGPISWDKSVSGLSSGSKYMSPSQSGQFSRYAVSASSRSSDQAAKTRSMPTVSKRRAEVQTTIKQLITFSRKTSSDIRREITKIKAKKDNRINDADIKGALDIADKIDKYALVLQQREKSLTDNDRDIDGTLQNMTDMSQQLQMQLQDAMNKQQQAMQILSNIMKNQHDTLKSIINNLK
jgi:hypothetical protein